ncbi:inactive hydroxysteroid dehydrogenase-like protein 1 [Penaeus indicus]|uniref:inactive hydroxysteroid dehydrogenase-like protein 1 n=1 Tax=Penaeus indicus TaxID=29960 RepID=UPI00300D41AA
MDVVVDSAKLWLSEFLPYWRKAEGTLAVVGVCYAGSVAISLLWQVTNGVRVHFWSRLWKKDLVGKYGKWAVVTGSTDGIGKSYAKELASKGMNILLVSRTKAKLEQVAQEITSKYGVETDIAQADFSEGRSVYANIAEHLKGKDIGILGKFPMSSSNFFFLTHSHSLPSCNRQIKLSVTTKMIKRTA